MGCEPGEGGGQTSGEVEDMRMNSILFPHVLGSEMERSMEEDWHEVDDDAPLEPSVSRAQSETERFLTLSLLQYALPLIGNTSRCGVMLAWISVQALSQGTESHLKRTLFGSTSVDSAPRRSLLPLRLGELEGIVSILSSAPAQAVSEPDFAEDSTWECWLLLAVIGVNKLYGYTGLPPAGKWRRHDRLAIESMRKVVDSFRVNSDSAFVTSSVDALEKELIEKKVNYAGEETLHCFPLSLEQILPALPPKEHGGCVDALAWTSGLTKDFLLHPERAIVKDCGQVLPKLQAKIHVQPGELDLVVNELIERNVCAWVPFSSVLRYRGEPVLNGLFGVQKPSVLPSGRPILRTIMNLVPSNSVLKQLKGGTRGLPYICQWLSTVTEGNEQVRLWQSDMSAAFYLFRVPENWWGMLAFNVVRPASEVGLQGSGLVALCCKVIPMGFNSSVSLMQEISEALLSKLPLPSRVSRGLPLPPWLTATLQQSQAEQRAWFHVYLDNFCSAARILPGEDAHQGEALHALAEASWFDAGVLSSAKKRKSNEAAAAELGAWINGEQRTIGVTGERLLKLIHLTLHLIARDRLNKKMAQIIAGRWIHVFQFRRPAMSCLDNIWKFIGGKTLGSQGIRLVRQELWTCVCLAPLMCTSLSAKVANWITASDASQTGGAVGISHELTKEGRDLVHAVQLQKAPTNEEQTIPILLVSLFNGIGGAPRSYNVLGLQPVAMIFCDISKEANRVSSRRWPEAELIQDVRMITEEMIDSWALKFTGIEEVHLWAGFPCSDLSAAKAFRKNLAGEKSGLYSEVLRIRRLLKRRFSPLIIVKFVFENVASMDREAAEEIGRLAGAIPYFLDPADCLPMHRPRLCWTSEDWEGLFEDLEITVKKCWVEIRCQVSYPPQAVWITPSWEWPGGMEGAVLPTAMRSVPKREPPPFPAGLAKCDEATVQRWQADDFRVPPYQYKEQYVFYKGMKWRRVNSTEKELLMGYGFGHTELCLSASSIKQSKINFEDTRQALLGDAFSVASFGIAAAGLCRRFLHIRKYSSVVNRLGMAPGFCAPPQCELPIQRRLVYGGSSEVVTRDPHQLNRVLLTRTNHSGSDVRISTGALINPKAFPRQPVNSSWWAWRHVFQVRWGRKEHINLLELRSIILTVRHLISHLHAADMRLFHVADSYICISVISKGRSSSFRVNSLLKQLNALLLAFNLYIILAHIESSDNPTDGASRGHQTNC